MQRLSTFPQSVGNLLDLRMPTRHEITRAERALPGPGRSPVVDLNQKSMSKQIHYPSPWEFEEEPNGQDFVTIQHEGCAICEVRGTDDMSCVEEDEVEDVRLQCIANAKLIAAAPDMLDALYELRAHFTSVGWNAKDSGVIRIIDSAIKKATK